MTTRTRKTTLMGATEVANFLGVSRQRVLELRQKHHDFPEPLEQLAAGPVWDKAAIEDFLGGWDRTPGRPRKHPLPVPAGSADDQITAISPAGEEVAVLEQPTLFDPEEPVAELEAAPVEQEHSEHLPEPEIPAQPSGDPYPVHNPVDPSEETLHYDNR